MYDGLNPQVISQSETKCLVEEIKAGKLRFYPERNYCVLIKGSIDNKLLLGLAKRYKNSSWISNRTQEITFKVKMAEDLATMWRGTAVHTSTSMVEKFIKSIFADRMVIVKAKKEEDMRNGMILVRSGASTFYFEHRFNALGEINTHLRDVCDDVAEKVNSGFLAMTSGEFEITRKENVNIHNVDVLWDLYQIGCQLEKETA